MLAVSDDPGLPRHCYLNYVVPLTDRKAVIVILLNVMINLEVCQWRAISKTSFITRVCDSFERPERSLASTAKKQTYLERCL